MGKIARKILIRQANCKDADAIYQIGKVCFTDAWRKETVIHDLTENQSSWYLVAEVEGRVIGYGCFWFVSDEGQLVNIGVHPDLRKQGWGEAILMQGIQEAKHRKMRNLFLEVRVSNQSAQSLYHKLGFQNLGLRKSIYDLPLEDGYVMKIRFQ